MKGRPLKTREEILRDRTRISRERDKLKAERDRLRRLEDAVRELEAEGWFAPWSDDPRVRAIREALS